MYKRLGYIVKGTATPMRGESEPAWSSSKPNSSMSKTPTMSLAISCLMPQPAVALTYFTEGH